MSGAVKVHTTVGEDVTNIDANKEIVKVRLIEAKLDVVQIKSLSDSLFGYRPKEAEQTEVVEIISRLHLLADQLSQNCSDIIEAIFGENNPVEVTEPLEEDPDIDAEREDLEPENLYDLEGADIDSDNDNNYGEGDI